jgi:anti-sigma regulatory factor (Ser/Thr protein kinase)/putative methionine-R-sulfoxide reductase with GAF domain
VALAVERTTLLEREQEARREAEEAGVTLRALQAIGEIGLRARTLDELLESLLSFLRNAVSADWASVLLPDEQGNFVVRAAVGPRGEVAGQTGARWSGGIVQRIAASRRPLVVDDLSEAGTAGTNVAPTGGSLVGVPLLRGSETIGVLSVGSDATRAFRSRDVSLLEAAAARVALAVERTVLFEREHEIAVTLQRSVLPQAMPHRPGVEIAVRYVPGASGLEVGGDWYDAIELDTGELGLVVGDVVGKGVTAAATMAQLRNALRVYALEGLKPASVVARLNRLVETTGPSFATLLYAVLDGEGTLRYASAGHPPPVLIRTSGQSELLEGGRSVPLGVHGDPAFRQDAVRLEPGETVLLYTDGLVERRDAPLEQRLQELLALSGRHVSDVEELVDGVLAELAGDNPPDDVAVLALRLAPIEQRRLEMRMPSRPQSLGEIRHRLRSWLATVGATETESHEIVLACSETSANAIRHSRLPSRPEVEVAAELADGEVRIAVRDYGRWVDPPPNHTGMGLRLVRETMDSVEIDRGDDGTRVLLRKRLQRAAAPVGRS